MFKFYREQCYHLFQCFPNHEITATEFRKHLTCVEQHIITYLEAPKYVVKNGYTGKHIARNICNGKHVGTIIDNKNIRKISRTCCC